MTGAASRTLRIDKIVKVLSAKFPEEFAKFDAKPEVKKEASSPSLSKSSRLHDSSGGQVGEAKKVKAEKPAAEKVEAVKAAEVVDVKAAKKTAKKKAAAKKKK